MAGEIQLNSTTMATESSGTITLSNVDSATNRTNLGLGSMATQAANSVSITGGSVGGVTLEGDVAMASSGLTVRNITTVAKSADTSLSNSITLTAFFEPTYTPLFSGSKVLGILTLKGYVLNSAGGDGRKTLKITLTGSGITSVSINDDEDYNFGIYDYGDSGAQLPFQQSIALPLVTTSTTDVITATCALQNATANTDSQWAVTGNNTLEETFMTWMEFK